MLSVCQSLAPTAPACGIRRHERATCLARNRSYGKSATTDKSGMYFESDTQMEERTWIKFPRRATNKLDRYPR